MVCRKVLVFIPKGTVSSWRGMLFPQRGVNARPRNLWVFLQPQQCGGTVPCRRAQKRAQLRLFLGPPAMLPRHSEVCASSTALRVSVVKVGGQIPGLAQ